MHDIRTPDQEAAEDIFFGQVVIIYARWFVVISMTILALWSSDSLNQMVLGIAFVVPLIALNFFIHGRYLMEKPANRLLLILLGVIDAVSITLIITFWPGDNGFNSQFYVLYYPIVLAFAFVFPIRVSGIYTAFVLLVYAGALLLADSAILFSSADAERLVIRLVTLAAMGMLAAYYYRILRKRRRAELYPELGAV